jgi:hypothetical protein
MLDTNPGPDTELDLDPKLMTKPDSDLKKYGIPYIFIRSTENKDG